MRALRPALEAAIDRVASWMSARRDSGRIRECHGDLHCGNIVRRDGRLLAFDCLEFDPALRWVDVAQELATLLADLQARHQMRPAAAFLGGYLARAADYQACRLLGVYQAHRALVRAKVAALNAMNATVDHQDAAGARSQYRRHIDCARGFLSARRPVLILMHGVSGSGKTWLAQRLAPRLGAVHLSSDRERKRIAAQACGAATDSRVRDLYSPQSRAQVYQHLAACAADTLAGGYPTIVDATFGRRQDRSLFQALAAQQAASLWLVHCHAPAPLLRTRIEERLRHQRDLSDADLRVLELQERQFEPLLPEEPATVIEVNTADAASVERLAGTLRASIGE